MATLTETSEWTPGIYQLETTDPVEGGPDGIDNLQARQLANRTAWLRELVEHIDAVLESHTVVAASETTSGHIKLATLLETMGGIVTTNAVTPAGLKAALDQFRAGLVGTAPELLNQLDEVSEALNNDPHFATTMLTVLADKAAKNHRHNGTDAPLDYAPDTGSANAYAIALTPVLTAHVAGLPIHFKAINGNTGASTLNVNGIGAVAIKNIDGSDLPAGAIVAGQMVTVIYTGAVYMLVSVPAGINTPAQFDVSKKPVNSEFVQRAMGSFSNRMNANTSQTLAAAVVGQIVNINGTGLNITLPLSAAVPAGGVICFENDGPDATISRQGTDIIFGVPNSTSFTLKSGETLLIESNHVGGWRFVGGSGQLPFSGLFGSSLATSGYQKLPSGFIEQWGVINNPANYTANTILTFAFPTVFPGGVLYIGGSNVGSSLAYPQNQFFYNSTAQGRMSFNTSNPVAGGMAASWRAIGY